MRARIDAAQYAADAGLKLKPERLEPLERRVRLIAERAHQRLAGLAPRDFEGLPQVLLGTVVNAERNLPAGVRGVEEAVGAAERPASPEPTTMTSKPSDLRSRFTAGLRGRAGAR